MLRILVVDDDAPNRESLANVLSHLGHTVDTAADGLQAIEMVTKNRPDLVILDLSMPILSGRDLVGRLSVPAIVWSGVPEGDEDTLPNVVAVVRKAGTAELLAAIEAFEKKTA